MIFRGLKASKFKGKPLFWVFIHLSLFSEESRFTMFLLISIAVVLVVLALRNTPIRYPSVATALFERGTLIRASLFCYLFNSCLGNKNAG
jgi:hypothetical protein